MQSPDEGESADWAAWASVPWTRQIDNDDTPTPTIGWHKTGVPYLPLGQADILQTLDIWLPATPAEPTPPPDALPRRPGTWIVYIHGGAWRDPRITASSFAPAAAHLLRRSARSSTTAIAALVSLNYRLSPHPDAPSQTARHPDHIADVHAALAFLRRLGLLTSPSSSSAAGTTHGNNNSNNNPWILTGHSCGATLALQSLMSPTRWGLPHSPHPGTGVVKPAAVVGFNGLYDLAGFVARPPAGYAHLREAYRAFTASAFGEDEEVWRAVCPASCGGGWVREWVGDDGAEGKRKGVVVLVQSREDTLVPYDQLEALRGSLVGEGERVEVRVAEAGGDHDEIWQQGGRMAEVLWEVAKGL